MDRISYILVVFLVWVTSTYAIKVVDVDTICKSVSNPSYCIKLLNSKPGASRDLVSFAHYTIDVAHYNVTNSINLIKMLISQSGSNAEAQQNYKECLDAFRDYGGAGAIKLIEETKKLLNGGNYDYAIQCMFTAVVDVQDCIVGASPSDPAYPDPSLLPEYAKIFDNVAETIIRILHLLQDNKHIPN